MTDKAIADTAMADKAVADVMITDELQGLTLTDSIFAAMFYLPVTAAGQAKVPYKDMPSELNPAFSSGSRLSAKNLSGNLRGPAESESGQDIYKRWKEFTLIVQKQAQYCNQRYNESFQDMCAFEDRINGCYAKGDELAKLCKEIQAKKEAVGKQMEALQKSIRETKRDIGSLQQKVRDLEKQKEIYDILRYIPFVNLVAEIVAAIDGTRSRLQAKKRELGDWNRNLQNLGSEWDMLLRRMNETTGKIQENERERKELEEKRKFCQEQRDAAARELMEWKDREKYCLHIEGEMEHLLRLEADAEAFCKLLADNPPSFQLNL